MSVSLRWDGLEELRAALRQLPEELAGEARHIVEAKANQAAADAKQGYSAHTRSGHLQAGLTVTHYENGKLSAGAIVKNAAKHAFIFEYGTQARHTAIGANRGSMPPGHVFVPPMQRRRREMYEQLKDLLVRKGLLVSGDAG